MYYATMFQAVQKNSGRQPRVQRVILLGVLAYEAIGAILGGILLIVRPDGRLMNMPVDIMNGVFRDFLLPGYILLGLGILNAIAFLAVLRRNYADWILASLANGGLLIWFVVEIAVLQQTHWLHFMWGFPIVVGSLMMLSLFPVQPATVRKALIICGILSSLIYVVANVVTVILYKGYDPVSQTVSELSAINAPTRPLWDLTLVIYDLFVLAFAWVIWQSTVKKLRIVAGLITLHIVFTMVTVALMIMIIVFGGVAFGKSFLFYSIATLVILIFFGILTGRDGPEISANLPTPLVGIWERINIGAYMLWIVILAFTLLQREKKLVR